MGFRTSFPMRQKKTPEIPDPRILKYMKGESHPRWFIRFSARIAREKPKGNCSRHPPYRDWPLLFSFSWKMELFCKQHRHSASPRHTSRKKTPRHENQFVIIPPTGVPIEIPKAAEALMKPKALPLFSIGTFRLTKA